MNLRAILWLLVPLLFAGAVSAPADTALKRLTLRQDAMGWEAVGRLDLDGSGFCSGALIAPDIVLTAAHCLVAPRTGARIDPRGVTFHAGLRDGEAIASREGRRAVLHPAYVPGGGTGFRQLLSDVALLELATPVAADHAPPFATSDAASPDGVVTLVSYARGRSQAPGWQRACAITAAGEGALEFSCEADFGTSGAPIFELSSGRPRIVSLISQIGRKDGQRRAYGMEISAPLAVVRDALRTGKGVWPAAEVTARRIGLPETSLPVVPPDRRDIGARFIRP